MKELYEILEKLPITQGAQNESIARACKICMPQFQEYVKGEMLLSPGEFTHKLCVLCEGNAVAYSAENGHSVVLRSFKPYELFGISNLFTDSPFATKVVAKSPCTVLILDKCFLSYLIDNDKTVRYQYIRFLAEKTLFLNQKIACLTAGSAEKRLAVWLNAQANHDSVSLEMPLNSLCMMLDMGRASLYRAFDQLEQDGFIKRDGKQILLYHREDMLSFYH